MPSFAPTRWTRSRSRRSPATASRCLGWSERRLELLDETSDPGHHASTLACAALGHLGCGRIHDARRLARTHEELTRQLTPHHQLHGIAYLLEVEELAGNWQGIRQLGPRVEEAVAANLTTPCVLNSRSLLVAALASAHLADEDEARRLEGISEALGMEGYSVLLDPPRIQLAFLRGELDSAARLLRDAVFSQDETWGQLAALATWLDAFAALGDRDRIESDALPLMQPGTYLEPFALRALGLVREDRALVEQAAARFDALGLAWHGDGTARCSPKPPATQRSSSRNPPPGHPPQIHLTPGAFYRAYGGGDLAVWNEALGVRLQLAAPRTFTGVPPGRRGDRRGFGRLLRRPVRPRAPRPSAPTTRLCPSCGRHILVTIRERLAFLAVALVVQKYGGTSVGNAERIKPVARRVVQAAEAGNEVCVVVSAMGDTTDELLELAGQVSKRPHRPRARHAAHGRGADLHGAPVDGDHRPRPPGDLVHGLAGGHRHRHEPRQGEGSSTCGRTRVREEIGAGKIAIVAGFQGVSTEDEVTTLGRGGSDATAVAIAAGLGADVCEIYTDVEGVYTADPRIVPSARKLREVSYEEMLELRRRAPRC